MPLLRDDCTVRKLLEELQLAPDPRPWAAAVPGGVDPAARRAEATRLWALLRTGDIATIDNIALQRSRGAAWRTLRAAIRVGLAEVTVAPVRRPWAGGRWSPGRYRLRWGPGIPIHATHRWMASVYRWLVEDLGLPAKNAAELVRGGRRRAIALWRAAVGRLKRLGQSESGVRRRSNRAQYLERVRSRCVPTRRSGDGGSPREEGWTTPPSVDNPDPEEPAPPAT